MSISGSWIVTGVAGGIGSAVAARLHQAGATVHGWDLADTASAADLASYAQVDVADSASVARATEALGDEPLAGVVHCAGILRTGALTDLAIDQQVAMVDINLRGTVIVAHALLPRIVDGGSLVMMGSASAYHGPPEFATYGATKAAVNALAEALRIELEPRRIAVTVCNPLFTETPMIHQEGPVPALLASMGASHSADEVADAIIRGIERRRRVIAPGLQVRAAHWASAHLGGTAGHLIMRSMWRRALRGRQTT